MRVVRPHGRPARQRSADRRHVAQRPRKGRHQRRRDELGLLPHPLDERRRLPRVLHRRGPRSGVALQGLRVRARRRRQLHAGGRLRVRALEPGGRRRTGLLSRGQRQRQRRLHRDSRAPRGDGRRQRAGRLRRARRRGLPRPHARSRLHRELPPGRRLRRRDHSPSGNLAPPASGAAPNHALRCPRGSKLVHGRCAKPARRRCKVKHRHRICSKPAHSSRGARRRGR